MASTPINPLVQLAVLHAEFEALHPFLDGQLSKSAFDTAWQRLMRAAIDPKNKKVTPEQRFGLHGMKHRGVTDTPGTKADKKLASGHKSDAMVEIYDHEVPVVPPPKGAGT